MADDHDSEVEDLILCSTALLPDDDDEEPKLRKQQFWVWNIFIVANFMGNSAVYIRIEEHGYRKLFR